MKKTVVYIALLAFILAGVFCVPVSAAEAGIVSIADHVISKDYVGDEVIVNYQLPLNPRFMMYGRKGENGVFSYLGSYPNLLFEQDIENNTATITTNFLNFMVNCPVGETRRGTVPGLETADFFARMEYLSTVEFNGVEVDYGLSANDAYLYSYRLDIYSKDTSTLLANYWFYATSDDVSPLYEVTNVAGKSANTLKLFGTEENPDFVNYYDYIIFEGWPLGRYYPSGGSSAPYYIDVSDIRSGSEFDLSFKLRYTLVDDGGALYADFGLQAHFLDENKQRISYRQVDLSNPNKNDTYSATFTVPSGTKYFYLLLETDAIDVKQCEFLEFSFDELIMSCPFSAVEHNSKTQEEIANKLDVLDGKIDGVIDGLGSIEDVLEGTNQKLDNIDQTLKPTPEQSDKADHLEDAIGNAAGKLENNNSNLEQLTPSRPQISTDLQLDQQNLLAVSPLITNIWSISGMNRMVGVVLMVATLAYVFFGKRDS